VCTECGCGFDTGLTCPKCGGRMVLVNNQATCLECGATPPADAHPSVHDEGHHHRHYPTRHAHEVGAKPNDLTKLRVLLPHWIAHNEEHADNFRQWAVRVREMGRDESARQIEAAVARMAACNRALDAALQSLEEMG
jgi:hypothetical protein